MYELALSNSEVLAQDDDVVLDSTIGGMLREAAVDSANTLALVEHNEKAGQNILKPFVLCDGVQSQRSVDREVALEKMKELGATMTTTEMFLFEEMGGADHENFRDVAKTVRKYK